MTTLSLLSSIVQLSPKRRGRGYGSGVGGHTTGRGSKGDKVRGKTKLTFDGTKIKKSWLKRLPFLRGKHRNLRRSNYQPISLSFLEANFKAKSTITSESFAFPVKILSTGKLTKPLIIKDVLVSKSAQKEIESQGGQVMRS